MSDMSPPDSSGSQASGADRLGADRAAPRLSRLDWGIAALSAWLVGGFYLDLWAHRHGMVDDTFFTPWHAAMYAGAAAFGVVLGAIGARAIRRGASWREALPGPYRLSFVGFVLFLLAGAGDLVWHEVFGFEVDTEALLSPTHLVLAFSGILMIGGPIRSIAPRRIVPAGWRIHGPAAISLAGGLAIFAAFTQYAHPILDPWPEAVTGRTDDPPAQLYAMGPDGSGQRRLIVSETDDRFPAWSLDGSQLAFIRVIDDRSQVFVAAADGSGATQLTTAGDNGRPAWSPDGTRIAFNSDRDGNWDIYVMGADGSGVSRVTDDPAEDWAVAWSPDGESLAYNSDRAGTFDLWLVDADGSNLRQLTADPGDEFDPAWSPDGATIAFSANEGRAGYDVYRMPADGSGPAVRLTESEPDGSFMPAWSPDGRRIAFSSARDGDLEVYVMNADGSEVANLTRNPGTNEGWAYPTWSPDGGSIAYPSQAFQGPWLVDWIRQNLGAASVLIQAALLAGVAVFGLMRGLLPFGSLALIVALPVALATVLTDDYRFIPGAIVAGLLADLLLRLLGYGRTRRRDALIAFAIPALFFGAYFATLAATEGIGWSIHLWLGAIILAGVVGLLLEELVHGTPVSPDTGSPATPTA